jgi:hypothetical protein
MTELKSVVLKTIIGAVDILFTPLLKFQVCWVCGCGCGWDGRWGSR